MDNSVRNAFSGFVESIINYLPNLLGGLILIGIGLFLGWLIKRVLFQLCVILRLERFLRSFRWGEQFAKADVRHALYNSISNIGFFLTLLVFLNAALSTMQLTVLSNLIERGVGVIPKLVIAITIAGLGWVLARWVSLTLKKALTKEEIPRATLIARFAKSVLLLFFSAMALVELDIAREIVTIGFTVIIITLGILSIVVTALGGKNFVKKALASFDED